ncbi:MAG TPA: flagellar basal body L-ring protein FlgH [Bryobacteraceae bacterium]|nr:flagellar basal body L-ring protein FlgH [Bryobacteraceae bacterium]
MTRLLLSLFVASGVFGWPLKKAAKTEDASAAKLDKYVNEVKLRSQQTSTASAGSMYSTPSRLGDAFRDVRAAQLYDLVTIVVSESTSAVSTGVTNTSRKSSVAAAVTSFLGNTKPAGPLANLANTTNNQQLQGQGTTSRTSTLSTTLTAEVIAVLPNGNLVVRGHREIGVNSEHQTVTIQGVVRPADLTPLNSINSAQVAQLEVRVDGKGVVGDSIKRPFILYRLLLGLLPF